MSLVSFGGKMVYGPTSKFRCNKFVTKLFFMPKRLAKNVVQFCNLKSFQIVEVGVCRWQRDTNTFYESKMNLLSFRLTFRRNFVLDRKSNYFTKIKTTSRYYDFLSRQIRIFSDVQIAFFNPNYFRNKCFCKMCRIDN